MDDIEYELLIDTIEKKRTARGARNKKIGSKSTYCGLLSDRLTPSQLKKKNGDVKMYKLNTPCNNWKDFMAMPVDIQKEYIQNIQQKFNVSAIQIAEMMGVRPETLRLHTCKVFGKYFLGIKKPSKQQLEDFQRWVAGEVEEEEETKEEETKEATVPILSWPKAQIQSTTPEKPYGNITFNGSVDSCINQLKMVFSNIHSDSITMTINF